MEQFGERKISVIFRLKPFPLPNVRLLVEHKLSYVAQSNLLLSCHDYFLKGNKDLPF